jgi:hypothetical protein
LELAKPKREHNPTTTTIAVSTSDTSSSEDFNRTTEDTTTTVVAEEEYDVVVEREAECNTTTVPGNNANVPDAATAVARRRMRGRSLIRTSVPSPLLLPLLLLPPQQQSNHNYFQSLQRRQYRVPIIQVDSSRHAMGSIYVYWYINSI